MRLVLSRFDLHTSAHSLTQTLTHSLTHSLKSSLACSHTHTHANKRMHVPTRPAKALSAWIGLDLLHIRNTARAIATAVAQAWICCKCKLRQALLHAFQLILHNLVANLIADLVSD